LIEIIKKVLLLVLLLLLFGCDKSCKDTNACKNYGQCITVDDNICVTGCEDLCERLGRCVPHHHGNRVECVTESVTECKNSKICLFSGKCNSRNGKCFAISDDDCKKSINCEWEGNCVENNGECVPGSESNCSKSKYCALFGKCMKSSDGCVSN